MPRGKKCYLATPNSLLFFFLREGHCQSLWQKKGDKHLHDLREWATELEHMAMCVNVCYTHQEQGLPLCQCMMRKPVPETAALAPCSCFVGNLSASHIQPVAWSSPHRTPPAIYTHTQEHICPVREISQHCNSKGSNFSPGTLITLTQSKSANVLILLPN